VSAADAEAAYYQGVEEFFVSRRGDPLLLSNADWLLIKRWRTQGVPLRIVLRGIADALDAHAHSWGRSRKVGSLRYCESEVESARERWERARGGPEAAPDVGAARPRRHARPQSGCGPLVTRAARGMPSRRSARPRRRWSRRCARTTARRPRGSRPPSMPR
jgi:hypothetical protein